jgi:hypothetical protein
MVFLVPTGGIYRMMGWATGGTEPLLSTTSSFNHPQSQQSNPFSTINSQQIAILLLPLVNVDADLFRLVQILPQGQPFSLS